MNVKVKDALLAGIMFFILSNPIVYKLVDDLAGGLLGPIAHPGGCPTNWGLIIHSIAFAAATYYGIGL